MNGTKKKFSAVNQKQWHQKGSVPRKLTSLRKSKPRRRNQARPIRCDNSTHIVSGYYPKINENILSMEILNPSQDRVREALSKCTIPFLRQMQTRRCEKAPKQRQRKDEAVVATLKCLNKDVLYHVCSIMDCSNIHFPNLSVHFFAFYCCLL